MRRGAGEKRIKTGRGKRRIATEEAGVWKHWDNKEARQVEVEILW